MATAKKAAPKGDHPVTKKRKEKKDLIASQATHKKDTGSIPVQVSILTDRIINLTEHLKTHPKDEHSRRGLLLAVGKRRKLLKYYKDKSKEGYEKLIADLGLRH